MFVKESGDRSTKTEPSFTATWFNLTQGGGEQIELNDTVNFTINGDVGTINEGGRFTHFEVSIGGTILIGHGNSNSAKSTVHNEIKVDARNFGGTTLGQFILYQITLANGTTRSDTISMGSVTIDVEKGLKVNKDRGHQFSPDIKSDIKKALKLILET